MLGGKERLGGAEEVVSFVANVALEYPVQAANRFPELGHLAGGWVGSCRAEAIRKALPLGIRGYIIKPPTVEQVGAKLKAALA